MFLKILEISFDGFPDHRNAADTITTIEIFRDPFKSLKEISIIF